MKHRATMIAVGAAMALAGCASTSQYADQSRQTAPVFENDSQYIAAVETEARRRGIEVHWVHPPKKRGAPDSD